MILKYRHSQETYDVEKEITKNQRFLDYLLKLMSERESIKEIKCAAGRFLHHKKVDNDLPGEQGEKKSGIDPAKQKGIFIPTVDSFQYIDQFCNPHLFNRK